MSIEIPLYLMALVMLQSLESRVRVLEVSDLLNFFYVRLCPLGARSGAEPLSSNSKPDLYTCLILQASHGISKENMWKRFPIVFGSNQRCEIRSDSVLSEHRMIENDLQAKAMPTSTSYPFPDGNIRKTSITSQAELLRPFNPWWRYLASMNHRAYHQHD